MHHEHWHDGLLPHWHISTWLFWGVVIIAAVWLFTRTRKIKRKGDQ